MVRTASVVLVRAVPVTLRVTRREVTALTWIVLVREAPTARLLRAKHKVRPDCLAPPVRVTTRLAGSRRQDVTAVAVVEPALVVRILIRMVSPLRS